MLLRTSILARVCSPLADRLTGGVGAERMLQELEDANAFVTSLDVRRSWFRYHHLFADLLALELRRAAPALVGSLHREAAEWHEQQGLIVEAVRHAQAARDWTLASRLLADHHIDLTFDGLTGSISQLLSTFPEAVVAGDAELGIARPLTGLSLSAGLELSQEAVRIADEHWFPCGTSSSACRAATPRILRHIYAKLGAHSRAEAVERARQLGFLAPSHRRRQPR